jgi:hypothetical protein
VLTFDFCLFFIMVDNVASVPTKGSGDQDPEVDTPEARRAAFVETIKALGVERKRSSLRKLPLVGPRVMPRQDMPLKRASRSGRRTPEEEKARRGSGKARALLQGVQQMVLGLRPPSFIN